MREKRLQKFEPVLLIDNKASTPNDIPDFTHEELNKYKKLTQETKQAEEKPQEESEEEISRKEFINKLKGLENKELGQLLINNSIKGRKTDKEGYTNDFTINKAGVSMGGKIRNKDYLTNRLLTAYNDGLVKI